MRLIDADALVEEFEKSDFLYVGDEIEERLDNAVRALAHHVIIKAPTVDIVRCRECKYLKQNRVTGSHWCDRRADKVIVIPDDYCSFGETK